MRSTSKERFQKFKARKITSGFIRFQPRITRYSHQHLTQLCKAYNLSQSAMVSKIISDTVATTKPKLDYHYGFGFIRLDLFLKPSIKSTFKTFLYANSGDCLAAWILAYPLPLKEA